MIEIDVATLSDSHVTNASVFINLLFSFSSDRQNFCLRPLFHLIWPIEYHRGGNKTVTDFEILDADAGISKELKNRPKKAGLNMEVSYRIDLRIYNNVPGICAFPLCPAASSPVLLLGWDLNSFSVSPCLPACRQAGVSPRPSFSRVAPFSHRSFIFRGLFFVDIGLHSLYATSKR